MSLLSSNIGQMPLYPPLNQILGNTSSENTLLSFIVKHQFDSLSLYDLQKIFAAGMSPQLSGFIQAAKACGVVQVNAIGATQTDWPKVRTYQGGNAGKFDGLVTEVEFWNGSNVGSQFQAFISQLQYMQSLGITPPLISPYIGWLNRDPNMSEAQVASTLAQNVSQVFVHAYVNNPSNAYGYAKSRITALTQAKPSLQIWPIFSAEGVKYSAGSEKFMGDWLSLNSLDAAENTFMASYIPAGFQYFEYSFLKLYLR